MNQTRPSSLISLHGGHSGQFCCHAKDNLEEIIEAYIHRGFKQVGITEHMPPPHDNLLYPDEVKLGLRAGDLENRFEDYFTELDRLKLKYRESISIYRGFETETVTGWQDLTARIIETYQPDYVVGSVHHVDDTCFDYDKQSYDELARRLGSIETLYMAYFDAQFEMIKTLQPFVVGHFDLIRIYDPEFETRMALPEIQKKIQRNLTLIKDLDLVLDYNMRPLSRGEKQPYLTRPILAQALAMDIRVVPGDDSHSAKQAGQFISDAVQTLAGLGFSTRWPTPWCRPMNKEGRK